MKLAKTKKWTHSHSIVWQIVIIFPIKSDDSITIEFDNPSSMSQFISLEKQVLMKRRKSNPKFKVIWKWGRFLPYWLTRINISLSSLQKEINGQNILTWYSAKWWFPLWCIGDFMFNSHKKSWRVSNNQGP